MQNFIWENRNTVFKYITKKDIESKQVMFWMTP